MVQVICGYPSRASDEHINADLHQHGTTGEI